MSESMMWLFFLVEGRDVCRKGGKEEKKAVLVLGTVTISVSAVPDGTFYGRHGLSLSSMAATCYM